MKILLTIFVLCNFSFNSYSEEKESQNDYNREIIFNLGQQTLGNTRTFGLAIADIDLDGDNDVFVCNYIGSSLLWLNDGNGLFTQSNQYFNVSAVHGVGIEDLNNDNYPDIFFITHVGSNTIYFNDRDNSFTEGTQTIGESTDHPQTIQLCDVDDDLDYDALIYNINAPNRIWLNDGNGVFTMMNIDYGGDDSNGMKLADFNGDSFPDLVFNMRTQPDQIWLNDGTGNFSNTMQALDNGAGDEDIQCKDIDCDEDIDIVFVGSDGITTWLNQNGEGLFVAGINYTESIYNCCLFDADSDEDNDLATISFENGNKLWINDGTGLFSSLGTIFGTSTVLRIAAGKLDSDSDFDILLGTLENTGGNQIYFNESTVVNVNEEIIISGKSLTNFPNPFNPSTEIRFQTSGISEIGSTEIEIYNLKGQKIKTIPINPLTHQPINSVTWNGTDNSNNTISSGIYYYKLSIPNSPVKKMALMK